MKTYKVRQVMRFSDGSRPARWTEKVYANSRSEAEAEVAKSNNTWNKVAGKRKANVQVGKYVKVRRVGGTTSFGMPAVKLPKFNGFGW